MRSIFPFGAELDKDNPLFDKPYDSGFSGWGASSAKDSDETFNVMVAQNEINIITIFRRKKGVNTHEDHKVFVPKDKTLEMTFDY